MKYKNGFISSSSSNSFITFTPDSHFNHKKEVKNNDGLDFCFMCGQPTKKIPGVLAREFYCVCQNPNCEWYKN